MGFGYRAALGELINAYVTRQLEIGYAVAELSKFSSNPANVITKPKKAFSGIYNRQKTLVSYTGIQTQEWIALPLINL